MKAQLEPIISQQLNTSFIAYKRETHYFNFHWHYHPEFELTLIEKGQGTRIVGDHTARFSDMDLVLLGSNLPHTWVSESEEPGQSAIVIQFSPKLISKEQLNIIEFQAIYNLLKRAASGLSFNRSVAEAVLPQFLELLQEEGLKKLTQLWLLLDQLSQLHTATPLASSMYHSLKGKHTDQQIDNVCKYIHEHFTRKITLAEMAQLASLTPTSFCRFFKKMTGMSFIEYVNELRISRAQKLLLESTLSVTEVAFQAGFESSTHFNRIFLRKNEISPRNYRKKMQSFTTNQYL